MAPLVMQIKPSLRSDSYGRPPFFFKSASSIGQRQRRASAARWSRA